ncbi:hypothetical protein GY45DRAFT_1432534 [Cubamyces sp. BRFM 1775]|nr:hypothetical protein GY45DRAFT_1432534 [Cubamyces sp. BRFM 1775]
MSATTLAFSRVCRSTAFTRYATRSLGTEALASSDSTSATPPPGGSTTSQSTSNNRTRDSHSKNKVVPQTHAVYVRPWDEIGGMPELLAMVRGLEKRFGRVQEFRIARDSDVPTQYLNFFVAEFAEEEAYQRVPPEGTHIKLEVPVSRRDRPGGVGLDELQGLLQTQHWDPTTTDLSSGAINPFSNPEAVGQRPMRTVELVVQRSAERGKLEEAYRRPMKPAQKFGIEFYRWGGFYQPPDGEAGPAMRHALSKWKVAAAEAAPSQTEPSQDSTSAQGIESVAKSLDTPELVDPLSSEPRGAESSYNAADPSRALDTSLPAAQSPFDELPNPPSSAAETTAPSDSAGGVTSPAQDASQPVAPVDAAAPVRPARLSQRQRILMLARQHAKTPLPQPAEEQEEAEIKAERERSAEEQRVKEENRGALLDALKKMMGGRW